MAEPQVDVSVIVAVRNGAATLRQCIDSVFGQEGCTVELIIVDAMSDDGTQEIVESYGDRIASNIREPDRGIYDAWNKALNVARGEWCAFLGADDYFLSAASVGALLEAARNGEPHAVFVFGGLLRQNSEGSYVKHPDPRDARAFMLSGRMLPHPGSLHHIDTLKEIGGFDSSFRIAGDMDAVVRLLHRGSAQRAAQVTTAMAVGGVSSRWSSQRLRHRERYRILQRELGAFPALGPTLRPFVLELIGYGAEVVLTSSFGGRRGSSMTLAIRRRLGQAPKLNRVQ